MPNEQQHLFSRIVIRILIHGRVEAKYCKISKCSKFGKNLQIWIPTHKSWKKPWPQNVSILMNWVNEWGPFAYVHEVLCPAGGEEGRFLSGGGRVQCRFLRQEYLRRFWEAGCQVPALPIFARKPAGCLVHRETSLEKLQHCPRSWMTSWSL